NADTDWTIKGLNSGTVSVKGTSVVTAFSDIGTLQGGTGADTFAFVVDGRLSGGIDGGGGSDMLIGPNANTSWTISSPDGGSVAVADAPGTLLANFVQIGTLPGGDQADTFTLQATGNLTGSIDGGDGANTLIGPDVNASWTISNPDGGSVALADAPGAL